MVDFKRQYLAVLRNEVDLLRSQYYKPEQEGTGHFNTAINVLNQRIKEIEDGQPIQVRTD